MDLLPLNAPEPTKPLRSEEEKFIEITMVDLQNGLSCGFFSMYL